MPQSRWHGETGFNQARAERFDHFGRDKARSQCANYGPECAPGHSGSIIRDATSDERGNPFGHVVGAIGEGQGQQEENEEEMGFHTDLKERPGTFVFPTAYDEDRWVAQAFKINATPTYVLIDAQGVSFARMLSFMSF